MAKDRFHKLGVHGLAYADAFCEFAGELRDELLRHPDWREMRQTRVESFADRSVFVPARQNGITTGHIEREARDLPLCVRFIEHLHARIPELCRVVGIDDPGDLDVEMNGMAYGQGAWLSSHTDHGNRFVHQQERQIAWMLYLTHPDDGEWPDDRGGAVRVWEPDGDEARLRPKFNRFAMFRVSPASFHEIETLHGPIDWEHCRLALSGWLRKEAASQRRVMAVYRIDAAGDGVKARVAKELEGSLAVYRLWQQQRSHGDQDAQALTARIAELEQSRQANDNAPAGTSFVTHMPGPKWSIVVIDGDDETVYFGPRDEYAKTSKEP